jgi:hypothetical protein
MLWPIPKGLANLCQQKRGMIMNMEQKSALPNDQDNKPKVAPGAPQTDKTPEKQPEKDAAPTPPGTSKN